MGERGLELFQGGEQTHPVVDWVFGMPLVSCHGE